MGEAIFTALDTVSDWVQGKEAAVPGGISRSWQSPWLVWRKKAEFQSRASLLHHQKDRA